MDLIATRKQCNKYGIFGELAQDQAGVPYKSRFFCYIAEHSYQGRSKVPPGVYRCVRGTHSLAHHPEPFEAFEIMGVPNHTGILFHIGNQPQIDSSGCFLLGGDLMIGEQDPEELTTFGVDWSKDIHGLYLSKWAFKQLMSIQDGLDEFKLTLK